MSQAIALGNNDVAFIAWSYDSPIPDCLGFAVYRQSSSQPAPTPLPAWVGFEGDSNANWQPRTTEEWPVQKFSWRDLTASAGATYVYEIVPMVGTPRNLEPAADPSLRLTTSEVTLTPERSDHVRAYFNRGILSTQHLVRSLPQGPDGGPSSAILLDHIQTVGDPLRASLAGQSIEALSSLLVKAIQQGGRCQGALYELNDPELVSLLDTPARVSLVLSNAGNGPNGDNTNADARGRLHADGVEVHDRMLGSGHIGHDKFLVYSAPDGSPQTVLTGSTNWTYTGLCAQSNNAIQIDDESLATAYLDFWNRLSAESFESPTRATQSNALRADNDAPRQFTIDGAETTLWFSPNTHLHSKPPHDAPEPDDMKDVFDLIAGAKQGILFLLFQPGSPSVLDAILKAQRQDHGLFVRGAATDPDAIRNYETQLHQRPGDPVAEVAAASAVGDQFSFWQHELLKSSPDAHAIIHDKIVVIDPLSPDCVVVTGSHNLGYRASYNNDENLLIVKGHRKLAEAYAVHVMDVYDHYRWRWLLQKHGNRAFTGLRRTSAWQDRYFARLQPEVAFWMRAAAPAPPTPV
jgi:phosphatidylserine/phosphatidylglycerophosphate/cardiolipin synthase-like enzyme